MLGAQDTSCPENITDGTQSSVYLQSQDSTQSESTERVHVSLSLTQLS